MLARCTGCAVLLLVAGAVVARGQDPANYGEQKSGIEGSIELPPPAVAPSTSAKEESPLCPGPADNDGPDPAFSDRFNVFEHRRYWPEVWGFTGIDVFASGKKMAPNGQTYYPL